MKALNQQLGTVCFGPQTGNSVRVGIERRRIPNESLDKCSKTTERGSLRAPPIHLQFPEENWGKHVGSLECLQEGLQRHRAAVKCAQPALKTIHSYC